MAYAVHAGVAGSYDPNKKKWQTGAALTEDTAEKPEEEKGKKGGYVGGGTQKVYYNAATLPTATSQEDYIQAMYDANLKKQKAALEAEYTANVGDLDRQAAELPGKYRAEANAAAGQAAVNRAAFHEQAAATGLNTGARGQAALAQNNALLGSLTDIRREESQAVRELEEQRSALRRQYQQQIAQAVADNEADRAAALYNEAKRLDESILATAVNQANENYKAWKARYG